MACLKYEIILAEDEMVLNSTVCFFLYVVTRLHCQLCIYFVDNIFGWYIQSKKKVYKTKSVQ